MTRLRTFFPGLVVLCLLTPAVASPVEVAVSIHPISAMVREVGGDRVAVSTIIPAGTDPHHFELTPKKARALHEADVILLIGGHFDGWLLGPEADGEAPCLVVEFSEAFTDSLIPLGDSFNPHFWLDPMFAKEMARIIRMALCTIDLANCDHYQERALAFMAQLDTLRVTSRDRLRASGLEAFVALHPAWTYLARRYGLREIGTLEVTHEAEPSARHIADVISRMKSGGIKIILAENFSNLELARNVAAQTGSRIVLLDPLGDEDAPGRDTYAGLMRYNLGEIEKALKPLEPE